MNLYRFAANNSMTILYVIFFVVLLFPIFVVIIRSLKYRKSNHYQQHKSSFFEIQKDTGTLGEYMIEAHLSDYLAAGCKIIYNLYLPKEDATTTEIDALLISAHGIFVFESKNYSGWIFGSDTQQQWTQCLASGNRRSKKEHFYNPILQNETHIKNLKRILSIDIPCYSIITFSDRCTLKNITNGKKDVYVINRRDVKLILDHIIADRAIVLTLDQINTLYLQLFPYSQVSEEIKAAHVDNIKKQHTDLVCPLCGGKLIKRTAKSGANAGKAFFGCSNYPKCRFTKSIGEKQ